MNNTVAQAEGVEMLPELKACPFCGSDELSHGSAFPGFNEECSGIVQCHDCDAKMLGAGEAEAISAWNTRVPLSQGQREGLTAEWCERMARLEGNAEIGAGAIDHPLRCPPVEVAVPDPKAVAADARNRLNIHARVVDYPGGPIGFERDARAALSVTTSIPGEGVRETAATEVRRAIEWLKHNEYEKALLRLRCALAALSKAPDDQVGEALEPLITAIERDLEIRRTAGSLGSVRATVRVGVGIAKAAVMAWRARA